MKKFSVKEIFFTLQGEGVHTGRASVFCRFAGCNLWNGLERSRASSLCDFCDTDFLGMNGENGGRYSLENLVDTIEKTWTSNVRNDVRRFVVMTGGEPLLQVNEELLNSLRDRDFYVAVETNGTQRVLSTIDWVCVSPKTIELHETAHRGDEMKLVYPQKHLFPEMFERLHFQHFTLQPMEIPSDPKKTKENIDNTLEYCLRHPQWRLGLQTHKILNIA